MKVAINTRFLLPQLEGIGTFTSEICKRIVLNNPDIEFHFLFDRPFDKKYLYSNNIIPHHVIPPARHPYLWKVWFEWAVPRCLNRIEADVFFSPDNFCSLNTNVPTLMVTHDLAFEHYPDLIIPSHLRYFKKYSRRFHHKADRIACVSKFTQKDVIEKYQIEKSKTLVVNNGCDRSFKSLSIKEKSEVKRRISGGDDFFLYIGSIHPRKNVERLIQGFEIFKSQSGSHVKLVLAGRKAWKTEKMESILNTSSVKNDIVELGHVESIDEILSTALALCYPSVFEGFGIPILEAFHAGVPVITSNVSSMPEIAGNAALLINPFNIEDIAKGLMSIESSAKLRDELILRGHEEKKLYSWDKSADIVMNTLKAIS